MKRSGGQRTIPKGWRLVRLGDVLELDQPGAWGEDPTPAEPGVRVLRAADLTRDGQVKPGNAAWRRLSERDLERRLMQEGDLILERSGGGPGTPVGRVALVQGLGSVYCNNFCQQLRVDRAKCTPKYAARTLWHRYTQGVTARLEHQTTGIRNLDYAAYLNLPVLLPPLPEQRAIAAVLDAIDDAIERTESVIAATEQLRDSLLHQLLTRGVPGWHTAWKDVPGLGTIPAAWEVVRLGEAIGSTTYGTNIQLGRDGAVAVLRMNNLQGGELDLRDVRRADLSEKESNDLSLVPGDILFNRTNSRDLVGKVAIVRDLEQPVSFASYLIRLRAAKTRANPYWLVALLGSSQCQDRIRKFATPGVSQANINPTNLKSLTISLPSLAEQQTVARVLDGAAATLVRVRQERARLQRVKDSTSDVLLTGQVRAMA